MSESANPTQCPSSPIQVGITLITGFLGSGKSTLIRRLLTENHNLRLVVVENEFGDTAAVEQAIVTQGVGPSALEQFIELPNGCICCAAQDDLVDALTRLVDQRAGHFDHILVEASGLADPRPVAASFWVDDVVDASLRLDSVVAVVDASAVEDIVEGRSANVDRGLALKQIAVADIVLLNKMDVLMQARPSSTIAIEAERLSARLRDHGCLAKVFATTRCDVDLRSLLNIRAYESTSAVDTLLTAPPDKFLDHTHDHDSTKSASTFTITFDNLTFDGTLLTRAFAALLWKEDNDDKEDDERAEQIWRMKALVVVENEEFKWIYQSVHTLFDDMVSSVRADGEDSLSRFLFIGQNMDRDKIETRLKEARVVPNETPASPSF